MKKEVITCDVIGCGKDGYKEVDCCMGWTINDGAKKYKKLEKPTNPLKTDLCKEHWIIWSKITCKLLKMDKEKK